VWRYLFSRNKTCNILELKCFGHVEPSRIVIVTPNPIMKLGFSFSIMP
jgi:hypothetical protein